MSTIVGVGLFVRKVRTASGATAVQIVSKERGVRRIVEHIGSAHTDDELAALLEVADTKIHAGQLAFDLNSLSPAKVSSIPEVAGSQSRVLWEVLDNAYRDLGFDQVGTETFKQLVLARIVEPTSKADTIRVLADLGVRSPSLRTIWRTLNRSIAEDWRSQLAAAAFAHVTADGALSIVMYDVTTLYFEAENEDRLRKVGMSKERRVDPQILIGLLVDPTGFPLEVHAFAGNRGETTTLLPVLNGFRERHGRADVVVVADAGMLSAANLNALEEAGFDFIVGSRTGSAPRDLADHYDRVGNFFADGATVETTREMGTGQAKRTRRVVWHYSRARERRDNITLNKQIERAQDIAEGRRPPKKDRFVSLGTRPGVNWDAVEKAREYLGLKGYVTSISTEKLAGDKVMAAYHDLFKVEASFRMAKTDLKARPMFHHERDSIEAHLTIVFAALAVTRHLTETSGYSIKRIITALRPVRDVMIRIRGQHVMAETPLEGDAADIVAKLRESAGH
ncbi:IS1634 family transposase [Gordonia sp. PP30]|uniref:IS1634 family transposase n=1 Tax=unclassified Gordonia (in: high G+C Gram-positive bacteria) TaxID=2657482 RepID=UPI0020000611|nr:IS1634 family transposase [Gordonia sp. PP30]UQE74523.1 IS1634 family transposase [Gordonia sp. PP30]UQE75137.1 IS1634 family transposase [Gordonia sp. PP30]UQE75251.1 IS1634 family transposase [Gordonia sp. PP30]